MIKRDGKVTMPFGVMGGAYPAQGHARFVSKPHRFRDGTAGRESMRPRAFSRQGHPLKVERGYSDAVRAQLSDMGHKVRDSDTESRLRRQSSCM